MTEAEARLQICGSYTLNLLADVVDHWFGLFGQRIRTALGDYGQLYQELLHPGSALRLNRDGANLVVLRWEDLVGRSIERATGPLTWADIEPCVDEIVAALSGFEHVVPCLVLAGPSRPGQPGLQRATADLARRLADIPNVYVEDGEVAVARYRVETVHDAASDRFGHVPYTPEAFAALGTVVARWYLALTRLPVKVLAVDGDHTLWSGVVGEDGVDGVRIERVHQKLQAALHAQTQRGRLLCLLSKNEEEDLRRLFAGRREMILSWDLFSARRVDWNAKADNLGAIANDLALGLDSVVFLDDNPLECAEMRARRPEVLTVRVPTDAPRLEAFVDHLWLFDQPRVTDEDRRRVRMYQEAASRAALRDSVGSLEDFLAGLELVIDIAEVGAADIVRLAQLSQRTNQFNASLLRCDEATIRHGLNDSATWHRLVRVRDRFGDYGIVGQLRGAPRSGSFAIDLFMLSCRALGRGVEHRMLTAAGARALELGLDSVELLFRPGDRNGPARRFLEAASAGTMGSDSERWLRLPAAQVAALAIDARAAVGGDDATREDAEAAPRGRAAGAAGELGVLYERIAHTLTTGADIVRALESQVRARPDLPSGFVNPSAGTQRELAQIWQEVLRIDRVGAYDRFQDLGGRSIHLVQVHRRLLERLGIDVDITTMFQYATVAALAAHLSSDRSAGAATDARQRAQQMREARARAATRHGVTP